MISLSADNYWLTLRVGFQHQNNEIVSVSHSNLSNVGPAGQDNSRRTEQPIDPPTVDHCLYNNN